MLSVQNISKGKPPRLPFHKLANAVLGARYEVSLVFVGGRFSAKLNRIYRGKQVPANVLAFPLSLRAGEIFIDLGEARKDAKKFGETFRGFVALLFIHALFHLKGYRHGSTMERKERRIRRTFRV